MENVSPIKEAFRNVSGHFWSSQSAGLLLVFSEQELGIPGVLQCINHAHITNDSAPNASGPLLYNTGPDNKLPERIN